MRNTTTSVVIAAGLVLAAVSQRIASVGLTVRLHDVPDSPNEVTHSLFI